MHLVTQDKLDNYLINDSTSAWLDKFSKSEDEKLVCQKWLRGSLAKRYIYDVLYGEYFKHDLDHRILDVGGGLTALTRKLAILKDYHLVDLLAHDSDQNARSMMVDAGRDFVISGDWADIEPEKYDVVIANDIFPNVDQRLDLFLTKFLPTTRKIFLSLTYYDEPRSYLTRRIDADEILCFLAWDGKQLRTVLEKYADRIVSYDKSIFSNSGQSVYPNGRQVCVVEFNGFLP